MTLINPFNGKQVIFADSDRIEDIRHIANEVMLQLFEYEPGEYLITDESGLCDFISLDEDDGRSLASIWQKIEQLFSVNRDDVGSDNLASLFEAVARRRSIQ